KLWLVAQSSAGVNLYKALDIKEGRLEDGRCWDIRILDPEEARQADRTRKAKKERVEEVKTEEATREARLSPYAQQALQALKDLSGGCAEVPVKDKEVRTKAKLNGQRWSAARKEVFQAGLAEEVEGSQPMMIRLANQPTQGVNEDAEN